MQETVKNYQTLSICLTCRDGQERHHANVRAGKRLADSILNQFTVEDKMRIEIRGVRCMSQCKRPCVVSIGATGRFSYIFGDLHPANADHIKALSELADQHLLAPEGFLRRNERPKPLRESIIGRLPPLGSVSELVTTLTVPSKSYSD